MKKLTIIGGGSVRIPFFANSLAKRAKALHITTLCLYDIDPEKLRIIGSIARHVSAKIDPELNVILETDLDKAILGTDYFVTTIRVGGDHSRVVDEQIAQKTEFWGRRRLVPAASSWQQDPFRFWLITADESKNWHRKRGFLTSQIHRVL